MGWWADTKRVVARAGTSLKTASGEIARDVAIAGAALGAGAACSIPPLTPAAPACAVAAAVATDKLFGEVIERKTRQAIDRAGQEADDFIDGLRTGKDGGPPPAEMRRTVVGATLKGTVRGGAGSLVAESGYPVALVLTAATIVAATVTLLALRKLGRI